MEVIETLNKQALAQSDSNLALEYLEQALSLLQYNADCGKIIDRNLIVTIIYNLAGVNQALCNLDKAAQYLEGTVFNLQEMIQNENNQVFLIKRMHLLAVVQLQYCGILSQLNYKYTHSHIFIQFSIILIYTLLQQFLLQIQCKSQSLLTITLSGYQCCTLYYPTAQQTF